MSKQRLVLHPELSDDEDNNDKDNNDEDNRQRLPMAHSPPSLPGDVAQSKSLVTAAELTEPSCGKNLRSIFTALNKRLFCVSPQISIFHGSFSQFGKLLYFQCSLCSNLYVRMSYAASIIVG